MMADTLHNLLYKFMDQYANVYDEVNTNQNYKHPFAEIIRKSIPNELKQQLDTRIYQIKGSCGAGRWTKVPWIGIFDSRITESAQTGVYIVYLLNKKDKYLYLTLNQGATSESQKNSSRKEGKLTFTGIAGAVNKSLLNDLARKAASIRETLQLHDLGDGTGMDCGSPSYDAGTIYCTKYDLDTLPDDNTLYADLAAFLKAYQAYYSEYYEDSVKSKFISYLGPEDSLYRYSRSYKMVFLLAMIRHMDDNGRASVQQISEDFRSFYADRKSQGLVPDKDADNRILNALTSTAQDMLDVIMANPYQHIHDNGFIDIDEQGGEKVFCFPQKLISQMTESDWAAVKQLLIDKLKLYYSKIDNPLFDREEDDMPTKEKLQIISQYIFARGFSYENGLIENFYLSLKSKPFVILAGTSGTGKTRLVKLFAEASGATSDNGRYKLVSVRPDWSDSSDLFGHLDLNGKFVPGAVIDFIKNAENDLDNPYFLCLDEMNLARVEYYLSDFLSIIETRDFRKSRVVSDPLVDKSCYGADQDAREKYGDILLPENLYIVGTVNMDETTFPFSRKVLDRANTIEFSYVDLIPDISEQKPVIPSIEAGNGFLKTEYLLLTECLAQSEDRDFIGQVCAELQSVNQILKEANAHVGYRVRDEIAFYMLNNQKAELLSYEEALDNQIMQKILPRIQGSGSAVKRMLCELFKFCAGDYEGYQTENSDTASKMFQAAKDAKYPNSAEKIAFMVRRYEEDGFTSYWL